MGDLQVRAGGAWNKAKDVHAKVSGNWTKAKELWVKVAGAWTKAWTSYNPFVYVAGYFTEKLYPDGSGYEWRYRPTNNSYIEGVLDRNYNSYGVTDGKRMTKVNAAGGVLINYLFPSTYDYPSTISVDKNGYIYVGMAYNSSGKARKYSGSSQVWEYLNNQDIISSAVDKDGVYSYFGTSNSYGYIVKLDGSGGEVWEYGDGSSGGSGESYGELVTDKDGYIYGGHHPKTGSDEVHKINSSGGLVWILITDGGSSNGALDVDYAGNIYVGVGTTTNKVVKYNSARSKLWEYPTSAQIRDVCVDKDGNVFFILFSGYVGKLSPSGELLAEYNSYGSGNSVNIEPKVGSDPDAWL